MFFSGSDGTWNENEGGEADNVDCFGEGQGLRGDVGRHDCVVQSDNETFLRSYRYLEMVIAV